MAKKEVEKIKDKATTKKAPSKKKVPAKVAKAKKPQAESKFPIVGIGASAGGLEAFESFFKAIPSDNGMAFVLVAHLDPTHVSILPELLQKKTAMKVYQVRDGMQVQPNRVYVIPPNSDLSILNGTLQLMEATRPRGANLPIDFFFRALAQDQGANAVAIVLSGTGTDGTQGLKAIKGETGMVMVQDEESAKYDGMPRSAMATNLADYILPPDKMPEQLIRYSKHAILAPGDKIPVANTRSQGMMQKIFILLRSRTNHDFSLYKKNTIIRRIERRMHIHQIDNLADYVRYLQESDREVNILFKELLINVTSFFRDPQAFEDLKEKILPALLKNRTDESTLRVWVPGCSSGEEPYSIAIVLHECMEALNRHFNVQIFGTDIDDDAINTARAGLYPASITPDVGAQRMKRYFIQENGNYRIKKSIREMLVFATQNMIKDPPFTKLDLLCCRNLLIYLGQELQRKIMPIFHYSLKPDGILFLGSSETIGQFSDLFSMLDKKWKIFKRKPTSAAVQPILHFPASQIGFNEPETNTTDVVRKAEEFSALQLVETILAQSDTPPCAVIDREHNIVYIHGRTGRFLEPAIGRLNVNIVEMARPGLKSELSAAIHNVELHRQTVVHKELRVSNNGGHVFMDLTVKPIVDQTTLHSMIMVIFEEVPDPKSSTKRKTKLRVVKKKTRDVEDLELDLLHTRESLQTTIEELETSNEELKSANEELQSTNEELQSTNEELETSKEELQSLNEEASTVNVELQVRIDELAQTNDDMKNLLDSTDVATIFLDIDLCVRRYTPKATNIVNLLATDIGRPISHLTSNLLNVDIEKDAKQVLRTLHSKEQEVRCGKALDFYMRILPYRTVANVIDGVVITFENITEVKRVEKALQETRLLAENIVNTVREPLLVIDRDLTIISANRSFYQVFRESEKQAIGQKLYDLGNRQWDIPQLRTLLEEILPQDTTVEDFEVVHTFPGIGRYKMRLNARTLLSEDKKIQHILLAIDDITKSDG